MMCINCGRGFHEECQTKKGCDKCHPNNVDATHGTAPVVISGKSEKVPAEPKKNKVGGTYADLKDPHSTGRKRAAVLYPLDRDAPCEWRDQKNCGGGRVPVVGCVSGNQEARHHGPVKNTTRNHLGNVHRICTRCHNHWHELNDLLYVETEYGLLPHDPVDASADELVNDELEWVTGAIGKRFTLASSVNKGVKFHE